MYTMLTEHFKTYILQHTSTNYFNKLRYRVPCWKHRQILLLKYVMCASNTPIYINANRSYQDEAYCLVITIKNT